MLFGILPVLKAMPLWIVLSGGVGGVIAGLGLGWLAGLLVRRLPVAWLAAAGRSGHPAWYREMGLLKAARSPQRSFTPLHRRFRPLA